MVVSKFERTRIFRREIQKKIKQLIKNEIDRHFYLKMCDTIKTKLELNIKKQFLNFNMLNLKAPTG